MIGLTGTHRTGKTTLAEAYAREVSIPFVRTTASAVFKQMGFDPQADYPLDVRLEIQEEILKAFAQQYREAGNGPFIADRTPIDMMAYTLADVTRTPLSLKLEDKLDQYIKNCIDLTNRTFAVLIVVQPGIQLVADESKAPITKGYIDHIAHLIMGITASEDIHAAHYYVPRHMTDLEDRVRCVRKAIEKTVERHAERTTAMIETGSLVYH